MWKVGPLASALEDRRLFLVFCDRPCESHDLADRKQPCRMQEIAASCNSNNEVWELVRANGPQRHFTEMAASRRKATVGRRGGVLV